MNMYEEAKKEIAAMKEIGMRVPLGTQAEVMKMSQDQITQMGVSEAVDLAISLAGC